MPAPPDALAIISTPSTLRRGSTQMKTQAAVLTERNAPWEIMELDVRERKRF